MTEQTTTPKFRAPRWAWLVATGFGSGYLRPASGTWGSLAGTLVWVALTLGIGAPLDRWSMGYGLQPAFWWIHSALELFFLALPVAMTWLAIRASDLVVDETGDKDPGYIVADEWAGVFVALWSVRLLVAGNAHRISQPGGWRWVALLAVPFLAFRLFDIWKPWPCHQIQDLPRGQGIVADDLVAGLYAIPLTQILVPFLLAR